MSVIQSKEKELRYIKRQNLEQEAKVIGNYYRDIIRSYGVDCQYYKKDNKVFEEYIDKEDLDQNTLLLHAYGYDDIPTYNDPVDMITYMEVENDIFQLQKFGLNPNADVNFYFDSIDFACALATKCGQLKEYKIEETEIVCEVPCYDKDIQSDLDEVANTQFPYKLGLGYAENYFCDVLSGKLSVEIGPYELDKEYTVICHPYEHTGMSVKLPVNDDLYKSFVREIVNDSYLETLIFLTYKVNRITVDSNSSNIVERYRYILTGKIHGGILFYDINKIGKYLNLIHPEIGDIVEIDFPNELNREKYEITDCYDKQLTTDGISPLLHNYVWKCKARRYIGAQEETNLPVSDGDLKRQEKIDYQSEIMAKTQEKVSLYPENEDMVYGGYEKVNTKSYDVQVPNQETQEEYDYLDGMTGLDVIRFACGSKMTTDGYDLYFVDANNNQTKMTLSTNPLLLDKAYFESGLRFLKATDSSLVFVNISGESFKLMDTKISSKGELQLCLNSMYEKTLDVGGSLNDDNSNFYVFKESRTYLWATETNLYCKFPENQNLYKLV